MLCRVRLQVLLAVADVGWAGAGWADAGSQLLLSSRGSLSLMLMFFTWLLRFACDATLKKPPPKMVPGLHATLTVKLRGLGLEIGSLSIVVLANA